MDFIPFNKTNSKQWDDLCLESDSAWFRHTTAWIDFSQYISGAGKNFSFAVVDNNKILAVVPLIAQPISGEKDLWEFSMGGTPTPFPALDDSLSEKQKNKILIEIFKEIDRIAKDNKVAYSRFFIDPLSNRLLKGELVCNPLLDFEFNEISLSTNIIDLSLEASSIFKNFRSGFRYDAKLAQKNNFKVEFFDKKNISEKLCDEYKKIYFSAAGKEVGTPERWKSTFDFIKNGFAVLALEKDDKERYVSGVILFIYKNNSYYAFGATIPEYKSERGLGHLLQWEIIKYLKQRGFDYYELGWNFYPIISDDVYSSKEINISFFKSGFGGKIYPLFRGEKFYSADYLKKRKNDLVDKFIENGYI